MLQALQAELLRKQAAELAALEERADEEEAAAATEEEAAAARAELAAIDAELAAIEAAEVGAPAGSHILT